MLAHEHLSAILELDQLCFGGLWSKSGYQRELDSPNSILIGLFLPHASKLLGMGCFWSILDEAHITILAVHPQYQRQGMGAALLYYLLEIAASIGCERATLEVRASNGAAIALYRNYGFQAAGSRPGYYKDEDALILWLSGLQHPQFTQTLCNWLFKVSDRLSHSMELVNCLKLGQQA